MSGLSINTFNNILLAAAPDVESKIGILRAELEIIQGVFIEKVGELLDELDANGYESEKFQEIRNVKNNTEHIFAMIDALEKQIEKPSCDACVLQGTAACSTDGYSEEVCEDFLKGSESE